MITEGAMQELRERIRIEGCRNLSVGETGMGMEYRCEGGAIDATSPEKICLNPEVRKRCPKSPDYDPNTPEDQRIRFTWM